MSQDTSKQSVLFEGLSKKAVVAKFDQDHASSDGGAILLKACDERLQLSETLAACLSDDREQSKVAHSLRELFQQRRCQNNDIEPAKSVCEDYQAASSRHSAKAAARSSLKIWRRLRLR